LKSLILYARFSLKKARNMWLGFFGRKAKKELKKLYVGNHNKKNRSFANSFLSVGREK
tara:strand:+ start:1464 stop:1637 length:174 start_codon:yes stop_codon:yes gene_type:complete